MDMGEGFEHQQQQQPNNEQHQQQQQQMQCEPGFQAPFAATPSVNQPMAVQPFMLPDTNGFNSSITTINPSSSPPFVSAGQVIPLPAPPQMKPIIMPQPQQQDQSMEQQHFLLQQQNPLRTEVDIDSLLLQQFSCMGTTDHEDLVRQFQSLMNNQVDQDAAKFYLEMSNWNLQTAVGCYLDIHTYQTLPSMKIIRQSRPSEHQQAFRIQNNGSIDWPNGCYLTAHSQKQRVEVPALKPGETCDILADIPPNQPAIMWKLCTPNGWNVGEPIWMVPPGMADTQAELSDRMSQLLMSADASNSDNCPQVNVVISVNME